MRVLLGTDGLMDTVRFGSTSIRAAALDDALGARLRSATEQLPDVDYVGVKLACECGDTDFRLTAARVLQCMGCDVVYTLPPRLRFIYDGIGAVRVDEGFMKSFGRNGRPPTEAELREHAEQEEDVDPDTFAALWRDEPPLHASEEEGDS